LECKGISSTSPFEPTIDVEGTLLESDEAAWREATIHAAELFKDIDGNFRPGQSWSVEVANEEKRLLFRSPFPQKAAIQSTRWRMQR
jgi:hypothetical protein